MTFKRKAAICNILQVIVRSHTHTHTYTHLYQIHHACINDNRMIIYTVSHNYQTP